MSNNLYQPRFALSLMIFFGVLIIGLRVHDVWDSLEKGRSLTAVQLVQAEDAAPAEKKPEDKNAAATPTETKLTTDEKVTEKDAAAPMPSDRGLDPSSELFKQLTGRREELDKRENELKQREALAMVTEKRIDQKIQELETLRAQLEKMVGTANAAQAAQLENMVKVYEIMKPKEAAQIFETMEMPVLLEVISKMKAARTAAVLAEMNPQRAKDITMALTQQDQLPQIK